MSDVRRRYFDHASEFWDSRVDAVRLRSSLAAELPSFRVEPDETILEVGCGTGNLTAELLNVLNQTGRVAAIDLSLQMISRARSKNRGRLVYWLQCDAAVCPLRSQVFDRVFCYSSWPHFPDQRLLVRELWRLLKEGGLLHIWHTLPRAVVNEIHSSAGFPLTEDLLAPASEVSGLLESSGFKVNDAVDDDKGFLVTAVKSGHSS